VYVKVEQEGRVFPVTDDAHTIVTCLLRAVHTCDLFLNTKIESIGTCDDHFVVHASNGTVFQSKAVLLATGCSGAGLAMAKMLGHSIVPPVPSLFGVCVENPVEQLSGSSVDAVKVRLQDTSFEQTGSVLITHFGFSGPGILALSSVAARYLHEKNYCCSLEINWVDMKCERVYEQLIGFRTITETSIGTQNPFSLPKKLWKYLLEKSGIDARKKLAQISNKQIQLFAQTLSCDVYRIVRRASHKGEFVMCGGVALSEIDCTTMQSKIVPGLFFAGEMVDIDGLTGGYNLQNAWTTGYVAGSASV